MLYYSSYNSPIGLLFILASDKYLKKITPFPVFCATKKENEIIYKTKKELDEYFFNKRTSFTVPFQLEGPAFYKKVWEELLKIGYGKTKTYGEIAQSLGNKNLSRVVGMACKNNNIPIIIPCHRCLGKNNFLHGFSLGLDAKRFLLDLEKQEGERFQIGERA